MLNEYLQFFLRLIKSTKEAASIIPLSNIVIKKVCNEIDFSRPVVVVEFAPGIGTVAEEVAKRMSPTSRLLLIEANPEFVSALQEKFAHDDRVEIFAGTAPDAEQIMKQFSMERVDTVLANIPFAFFDEPTKKSVIRAAKSMLKPGGVFVVCSFTAMIRPYLQGAFSQVTEKIIWQNLPPLRAFIAKKE